MAMGSAQEGVGIPSGPPERSEGLKQDDQHEVRGSHGQAYWPESGTQFKERPGARALVISNSTGSGEGQPTWARWAGLEEPSNAAGYATDNRDEVRT